MSYLAIDFGKKRSGLAYSDESNTIAVPHSIVQNGADSLGEIEKDVERDYFMSADEAKKYGIVDEIFHQKGVTTQAKK